MSLSGQLPLFQIQRRIIVIRIQEFNVRTGDEKVEAKPLNYSIEKFDIKGIKEIGY